MDSRTGRVHRRPRPRAAGPNFAIGRRLHLPAHQRPDLPPAARWGVRHEPHRLELPDHPARGVHAKDPVTSGGYSVFTYSPPADLARPATSAASGPTSPATPRTSRDRADDDKRLSNKWMGRVAFSWNASAELRRRRPVNGGGGPRAAWGTGRRAIQRQPHPTDLNSLADDYVAPSPAGPAGPPSTRPPPGRSTRTPSSSSRGTSSCPGRSSRQGQIEPSTSGPRGPGRGVQRPRDTTVDALRYDDVWDLDLRLQERPARRPRSPQRGGLQPVHSCTTLQRFADQLGHPRAHRRDPEPRIRPVGARFTF